MKVINGFLFGLIFHFVIVLADDIKRLLFNDPQTVQTLLHQYEVQLQQLQQKVSTLESEKTSLESRVQVMENGNQLSSNGAVVYTRWGRTTCPAENGTEMVYAGFAGGTYYSKPGGAADILCLPHDPAHFLQSSMITLDGPTFASAVHGSEYQFAFGNIQRNDDVPCAVCRVTGANTVLMVPGKVDCHKDWKKQYSGLLTANHEGHPGTSEYACVDEHPEGIEGTRTHDDEGKLFYPARSICGSLPCPPYVNKGFLSCVVCTR